MDNCPCTKNELDLFKTSPIQLAEESTTDVTIFPVSAITDSKAPIEFFLSGSGENYIDLNSVYLYIQAKILTKAGEELKDTDHVSPVNYFLHSLFSKCTVILNDKPVISQVNYPYRCMFEPLLFYPEDAQKTFLSSALFFKDTAGYMDSTDPTKDENKGLKERYNLMKKSGTLELYNKLQFDLAFQTKLLINNVDIRIKLERSKDNFSLISNKDDYKIEIKAAFLKINKIDVASSVIIGIKRGLQNGVVKMPFRRTEIRTFILSSGILSETLNNCVLGQMPSRVTVGLVSNKAFNGDIKSNPYNFQHFYLNYICILKDKQMVPTKPYTPNYEKYAYARNFNSIFEDGGNLMRGKFPNITYNDYSGGYALYCFDLTPDHAATESHISPISQGTFNGFKVFSSFNGYNKRYLLSRI